MTRGEEAARLPFTAIYTVVRHRLLPGVLQVRQGSPDQGHRGSDRQVGTAEEAVRKGGVSH
jgi:hypothetical protein